MLDSHYRRLAEVTLPHRGRRRYMHGFDLALPVMAEGYEDYLSIVLSLTQAAGAVRGRAYMTVDEKTVPAGATQRRPGPHVDGCFSADRMSWTHDPTWLHVCNNVPVPRMPVILASDTPGCRAWSGRFEGSPTETGDLSHISHLLGEGEILAPGVGYLLSPDCVHESLVMPKETKRTFLRIALPTSFGGCVSEH